MKIDKVGGAAPYNDIFWNARVLPPATDGNFITHLLDSTELNPEFFIDGCRLNQ